MLGPKCILPPILQLSKMIDEKKNVVPPCESDRIKYNLLGKIVVKMNVRLIVIPVLLNFVSGACLVEITLLETNLSVKCFEILALKTDEFRFIFAHAQG